MGHSRRLLNSPQVVRLSDVTVSVANADREYGANLFYRFNVSDRIRGCVRGAIPEPTNGSRSEIRSTPRLPLRGYFINV
jgi:hypothetical protein